MDYIKIGNTNLIVDKIVRIFKRGNSAIAVDNSGTENVLLTSTPSAVDSYIDALLGTIKANKIGDIIYHWFDINSNVVKLLNGTCIVPDVKYDGKELNHSEFVYEVTDDTTAIFKEGKLFGLKKGNTSGNITKDEKEVNFNIEVLDNNVSGLFSSPDTVKATSSIDMIFKYNGNVIANSKLKWKSYDKGKATVANGKVTGVAEGTAIISATFGNMEYIKNITILKQAPEPSSEERSIEVEGTFTGQMPVVDGFNGAKWVSSDPTKAIVVESTGVVTGVAQGTAKITGKFTSPYETDGIVYNVTVTPKAQPANIFWG